MSALIKRINYYDFVSQFITGSYDDTTLDFFDKIMGGYAGKDYRTMNWDIDVLRNGLEQAIEQWGNERQKKIKTPSDLKLYLEMCPSERYFFTRDTMKFFGDTMSNFGLRYAEINGEQCFELWRKRPVKHGLQSSFFFRKLDLKRVHI